MRAGVGTGVVAVEGEHARVRAVVPVAPAKHAALGYAVVPVEVVAFVVVFLGPFVREKSKGAEQDLSSLSFPKVQLRLASWELVTVVVHCHALLT